MNCPGIGFSWWTRKSVRGELSARRGIRELGSYKGHTSTGIWGRAESGYIFASKGGREGVRSGLRGIFRGPDREVQVRGVGVEMRR